jgi:hypothetical protein
MTFDRRELRTCIIVLVAFMAGICVGLVNL